MIDRKTREASDLPPTTGWPTGNWHAVLHAAPFMVWIAGPDGMRRWCSDSWLVFTGSRLEAELDEGWLQRVHEDDRERCAGIHRACMQSRAPFTLDYRLRQSTGGFRWVLDSGAPYDDPAGVFAGFVGGCIDIHERRLAEDELAERQRLARLALASLRRSDKPAR